MSIPKPPHSFKSWNQAYQYVTSLPEFDENKEILNFSFHQDEKDPITLSMTTLKAYCFEELRKPSKHALIKFMQSLTPYDIKSIEACDFDFVAEKYLESQI